jgi:hypothetical protein
MNILMLDKSYITDRRIVLEAEALIEAGHQVILCSGRENLQQKAVDWDNHLKIYRVFTDALLAFLLTQSSETELQELNHILGEYKNRESSRLKAYLKFALTQPKGMLIQLNRINAPLPKWLKQLAEFGLSCLSFNLEYIQQSLQPSVTYWLNQIEQIIIPHFKPDVIHCHDYSSLETGVALSQKYGIPLVYDAHELYSYQPGLPQFIAKEIFKKEKQLIQHAHTCITVNQQQANIMANDFNYHRFLPITNATVEPKDFNPNAHYDLIRQATSIPEDEGIML